MTEQSRFLVMYGFGVATGIFLAVGVYFIWLAFGLARKKRAN